MSLDSHIINLRSLVIVVVLLTGEGGIFRNCSSMTRGSHDFLSFSILLVQVMENVVEHEIVAVLVFRLERAAIKVDIDAQKVQKSYGHE